MDKYTYLNNANPAFVEDLYIQFKQDPASVDPYWKRFFEGYDFSASQNPDGISPLFAKEVAVSKLIDGFRSRGHLLAQTNPVRERRHHKADLELGYFGLSDADMDTEFEAGADLGLGKATLRSILDHLNKTYCSAIGAEYMYCRNEKLREYLQTRMEPNSNGPRYSADSKKAILNKLNQAVSFENFLHTKFVGKKRFSLEGLEAFIPALDLSIRNAANTGAKEVVLGMAHRGRLNLLVNVFQKPYENVFAEFEENIPDAFERGGDVKYHLGKSADITTAEGNSIHLSMLFNPSHLETIGGVLQGICYAKSLDRYAGDVSKIIPIVIHGDAAVAGQGINYELANMSGVSGFNAGGSVHIVLNNQVGFTTNYNEARTSVYCTDIAKITESPVFHVNADHPEAVAYCMQMAFDIRQQFGIDVYVDILGYRRYGHNEGDEPRFTQPILYKALQNHPNIYKKYLEQLLAENVVNADQSAIEANAFDTLLQERLDIAKSAPVHASEVAFQGHWSDYRLAKAGDFEKSIETGVKQSLLDEVAAVLYGEPADFTLYSKMQKILENRKKVYTQDKTVDWATAELLAYGTLLTEGHAVRLAGQDAQRGTFSHRHAVIKDAETEKQYCALKNLPNAKADINVYNTILSEYGAMSFEYGYSLASPNSLVIWEAQFGDFANGAQILIDQFLSSSEVKWDRFSGLTLLLPHGQEGQGPEHSSARLERFLQLCAQENMFVANITSPANFFHLLRRQVHNQFMKPLVVMSPKSLFRHPRVISPVSDLVNGHFQEIIDDASVDPKKVRRVVLCSGKVYYDILEKKEAAGITDIALVRFEQLYPLPQTQLAALRKRYAHVKDWVWAQEEPGNQGAWFYILRLLHDWNLRVISRPDAASPATGSLKRHEKMQAALVSDVLA
jgi:2-oxoglutarate dehydrogenase E1 component